MSCSGVTLYQGPPPFKILEGPPNRSAKAMSFLGGPGHAHMEKFSI